MKVKMTIDELQQMDPCKEAMDFVRKTVGLWKEEEGK
jgi:molybdopterin synthase catalytic subunit